MARFCLFAREGGSLPGLWTAPTLGRMALSIAAVLTLACGCPGLAQSPAGWRDAEVGTGGVSGSHADAKDGSLVVTGTGRGVMTGENGWDSVHYTYRQVTGDVEIIARLRGVTGGPGAQVGLMVRGGTTPGAAMGSVLFLPGATGAKNAVNVYARVPGGLYPCVQNGAETPLLAPPLWLKLTRVGQDFAVYKSSDGVTWAGVQNDTGAAFTLAGPRDVGFAVSSGTASSPATAVFDHVSVGKPNREYESSWVGNTFSQDSAGYVSGGISSLYTAPDGTCYTNAYYDEAGEGAKIYKDGKVVKAIDNPPSGNNRCYEGAITGDENHLYLVSGYGGIYQMDKGGTGASAKHIFFATNLRAPNGDNLISGMAANGSTLFVSAPAQNKVLAASLSAPTYYTAGNSDTTSTKDAVDTKGVRNAAPQSVYQTMRHSDYLPYHLPGFTPGVTYTIRLHFAEIQHDKPGQRLLDVAVGSAPPLEKLDVVAEAGGKDKALVKEFQSPPGADGFLNVTVSRSQASPDPHAFLSGMEVLAPDGAAAFRLNCGGAAAGAFLSDVQENPARDFPFTRPGPLALDKRGDLWIIQEANDFPAQNIHTAKYPGAIKCCHPDGTFTGRQITDLVSPTALCIDPNSDRLLVCENGPDQNIRLYTGLDTAPKCAGTFGVKGGIYSGKTPGLLHDPQAGGDARFHDLDGVGVDSAGNIFVASSGGGADLRQYTPGGALAWRLLALDFCNTGDFDPEGDGQDVYTPDKHYTMNYASHVPGSEWGYQSYLWNPRKGYPNPNNANRSAVFRRLGPEHERFLFTSSQGRANPVLMFRFDGETLVPCGRLEENGTLWVDKNGDGQETPDEVTTMPGAGIDSFDVDIHGGIWTVGSGGIRHLACAGVSPLGVLLYSLDKGAVEDIPIPPAIGAWTNPRIKYDRHHDTMYLLDTGGSLNNGKQARQAILYRIERWTAGNRTPRYAARLPQPDSSPNFLYAKPYPYGLDFCYYAMDMAGDKVFVSELWGPIHVFQADTSAPVTVLSPGPEVSGLSAWEDENMGLRVYRRANGEYEILEENSGFRARENLYRWTPKQ